jgi:hypothetical protein
MTTSLRDGSVKGGHVLQLIDGPTLEVFVTVEPTPLYKKLDEEFNAGLIDPDSKNSFKNELYGNYSSCCAAGIYSQADQNVSERTVPFDKLIKTNPFE